MVVVLAGYSGGKAQRKEKRGLGEGRVGGWQALGTENSCLSWKVLSVGEKNALAARRT